MNLKKKKRKFNNPWRNDTSEPRLRNLVCPVAYGEYRRRLCSGTSSQSCAGSLEKRELKSRAMRWEAVGSTQMVLSEEVERGTDSQV